MATGRAYVAWVGLVALYVLTFAMTVVVRDRRWGLVALLAAVYLGIIVGAIRWAVLTLLRERAAWGAARRAGERLPLIPPRATEAGMTVLSAVIALRAFWLSSLDPLGVGLIGVFLLLLALIALRWFYEGGAPRNGDRPPASRPPLQWMLILAGIGGSAESLT